jgi:hypothetical protein
MPDARRASRWSRRLAAGMPRRGFEPESNARRRTGGRRKNSSPVPKPSGPPAARCPPSRRGPHSAGPKSLASLFDHPVGKRGELRRKFESEQLCGREIMSSAASCKASSRPTWPSAPRSGWRVATSAAWPRPWRSRSKAVWRGYASIGSTSSTCTMRSPRPAAGNRSVSDRSAWLLRPSHLPASRRFRSRAPRSLATVIALSNSEIAPSTWRISLAVGASPMCSVGRCRCTSPAHGR